MAQSDSSRSLAFKQAERVFYPPVFYSGDTFYQLYEQFQLVTKANQGDPLAQHELGARYLTGDGFVTDTLKSFFWINKAADAGLPIALYNRGIFLTNGWGTKWNPFDAFRSFSLAAAKGFSQAKYVLALLFTENLVVPRNLDSAYFYMRWAANDGFEPAQSLSEEILKRKNSDYKIRSSEKKDASVQLNYIDFTADTTSTISDSTLIREFLSSIEEDSLYKSFPKNWTALEEINSKEIFMLFENLSDYGNAEAMTLLAKYYQSNFFPGKDLIKSIELLLRAYRLESFRAASILNETLRNQKIVDEILKKAERGEASSQYIIATLTALNFSRDIYKADVVSFYRKASQKNFAPAKNELAGILISGNFTEKNIDEGLKLYDQSITLGNMEAASRKALFEISTGQNPDLNFLFESEKRGAIISQISLGYIYEKGIGVEKNLGKAVGFYRSAAFRGSNNAYEALKKLYESLRPDDPIFIIDN